MTQYGEASSGWGTLLRRLSASFRVGHFFGVEVRLYWLALVLLPLFAWIEIARWGIGGGELAFRVLFFTASLFGIVWLHEMGHILAARRYHVVTPLITISPLGGLAHLSTAVPHPRAEIFVSLAGPATHLLVLAVVWPLSRIVGPDWLRPDGWWAGWPSIAVEELFHLNLALLLFNLLPIYPLDGGRVFRAALSTRVPAQRATLIACRVGQVGAVAFVLYGLFQEGLFSTILVVIGITVFLTCMQEIRALRYHAGPYAAAPRAPWESDPEAWKRSSASETRHRKRTAKAGADLAAEVDRVLDRLNEVGLSGLTRKERKVLDRAAKARRKP